jgi:hypothetical protein
MGWLRMSKSGGFAEASGCRLSERNLAGITSSVILRPIVLVLGVEVRILWDSAMLRASYK